MSSEKQSMLIWVPKELHQLYKQACTVDDRRMIAYLERKVETVMRQYVEEILGQDSLNRGD